MGLCVLLGRSPVPRRPLVSRGASLNRPRQLSGSDGCVGRRGLRCAPLRRRRQDQAQPRTRRPINLCFGVRRSIRNRSGHSRADSARLTPSVPLSVLASSCIVLSALPEDQSPTELPATYPDSVPHDLKPTRIVGQLSSARHARSASLLADSTNGDGVSTRSKLTRCPNVPACLYSRLAHIISISIQVSIHVPLCMRFDSRDFLQVC